MAVASGLDRARANGTWTTATLWPTYDALVKLTAADENKSVALIKKALS